MMQAHMINLPILHNCNGFLLNFLFVQTSLVSLWHANWSRGTCFQDGIDSRSTLRSLHLTRKVASPFIRRLPGFYLCRSGHGIVLLLFFIVPWKSPCPLLRSSNIICELEFSCSKCCFFYFTRSLFTQSLLKICCLLVSCCFEVNELGLFCWYLIQGKKESLGSITDLLTLVRLEDRIIEAHIIF